MKNKKIFEQMAKKAMEDKSILDKVQLLFKMVASTVSGAYKMGSKNKYMLMAGVAYLVSPIDFIPELFIGPLGLFDDAAIAAYLFKTLFGELEDFMAWENQEKSKDVRKEGAVHTIVIDPTDEV